MTQVLSPKTLVGSQLPPPVGLAKDWMWGQSNLQAALAQVVGDEGTLPATDPCHGDAPAERRIAFLRSKLEHCRLQHMCVLAAAAAEVTVANTSFPPFPETAEQAHVRYTHAFEVSTLSSNGPCISACIPR